METSGEPYPDSEEQDSWSDDDEGKGDGSENDDLGLSLYHDMSDERAFEVLSPEEVIEKQQQAISRVRQVLPTVPIGTARIMLQHFKWDASKMLEELSRKKKQTAACFCVFFLKKKKKKTFFVLMWEFYKGTRATQLVCARSSGCQTRAKRLWPGRAKSRECV